MTLRKTLFYAAMLTGGLMTVLSLPAHATDSVTADQGLDIRTMCGTKPVILGVADGYGGDSWRKIKNAELKDEAAKCPNITKILFTDASGDPQKANSDINSLVAQGINILLVQPDFPASQLPAMREAVKAGVIVIPFVGQLSGRPGVDYTANVYSGMSSVMRLNADWLGDVVKGGNILYFGGTPGNPISQGQFEAFVDQLKKYPDLHLLEDHYIVSNWNEPDTQKAMTGLLAKYDKIDAIVADYGVVALAVIKTFKQANLPVPVIATEATSNELNCLYLKDKKEGNGWKYVTRDGSTANVRFALRRGMSEYQGTTNTEPLEMIYSIFADSEAGIDPKCDESMPPDADLSSLLPMDQMKELFKK